MQKAEIRHAYPGKSAGECYAACLALVDQIGYRLFKKRDIANLVICSGALDGNPVDLTFTVPLGSPTSVVISLAAEKTPQPALEAEAARILERLSAALL